MELYSGNENYKLYHGNMLDMSEVVDKNTIDSIVCDPPYELNFMWKWWDNSWIAFQKETWKKCLEVLKPWWYLLAFGGSRTYHRIACAIEDAWFEIRDCIMWLYGSWFPKSMNIWLAIDKRWATSISRFWGYLRGVLKERNMTYSDLAKHFPSKTWWITGCVHNRIEWKNMPTLEQFNKICEILDLPFDKLEEAEREVIWSKKTNLTVYQNIWDRNISWEVDITAPSTELAKQRAWWGTALKPSYEPIIVARKPCEWSCTDNVIKYWVGWINIDECRVWWEWGRFPANTIFTYDEKDFEEVCWWLLSNNEYRYYYCAKASKKDRDEGLENFEIKGAKELLNREENSDWASWNGKYSSWNAFAWSWAPKKNIHPTVKPTELMQYLVRLVTPNGWTVLDPFNWSGSTWKAVMYENKDRNKNYKYIWIELTEEYLPIAKARIEYAIWNTEQKESENEKESVELKEKSLFDF